MIVHWPKGAGHCAKQVVRATVVAVDGRRFVGFNHVRAPQGACPRVARGMASGEGYHLCGEVCRQAGHAEVNALRCAGEAARGARLYVEGHTYVCADCQAAADAAGVREVIVAPPPVD